VADARRRRENIAGTRPRPGTRGGGNDVVVSQIALAFGLCGDDWSTVEPRFLIDSSSLLAKMLSRS
jgi:hypothetical protein